MLKRRKGLRKTVTYALSSELSCSQGNVYLVVVEVCYCALEQPEIESRLSTAAAAPSSEGTKKHVVANGPVV